MQTISRQEARELIDGQEDLTIIETLAPDDYEEFHIPGARNVPLDDSFPETIRNVVPDPSTPVLVYCLEAECSASAKAAQCMEDMGYRNVYDYEAGKVDWKAAGLPIATGDDPGGGV